MLHPAISLLGDREAGLKAFACRAPALPRCVCCVLGCIRRRGLAGRDMWGRLLGHGHGDLQWKEQSRDNHVRVRGGRDQWKERGWPHEGFERQGCNEKSGVDLMKVQGGRDAMMKDEDEQRAGMIWWESRRQGSLVVFRHSAAHCLCRRGALQMQKRGIGGAEAVLVRRLALCSGGTTFSSRQHAPLVQRAWLQRLGRLLFQHLQYS
eukprot:scaffold110610_cov20-Tisochrysis_lutea.AAC.1